MVDLTPAVAVTADHSPVIGQPFEGALEAFLAPYPYDPLIDRDLKPPALEIDLIESTTCFLVSFVGRQLGRGRAPE